MTRCVERGGGLPEGRRKSGVWCDDDGAERKVHYRTVEAATWLATGLPVFVDVDADPCPVLCLPAALCFDAVSLCLAELWTVSTIACSRARSLACYLGLSPSHSVPFGVLFRDEKCANLFEALMGTLRAAKRRKVIDFEGEMLFQGVHDDVPVSLVG